MMRTRRTHTHPSQNKLHHTIISACATVAAGNDIGIERYRITSKNSRNNILS